MKIIALDVGGTNIRVALVEDAKIKNIKNIIKEKTLAKGTKKQVLNQIISLIKKLPKKQLVKCEGIALGLPSRIKNNKIIYTTNIPKLKNCNIISILNKEFKLPIKIVNDAECFALGEKNFGLTKKYSSSIGLILGTGLGLGIIKNHKLISQHNFFRKEIGSYSYLDGCFEDYCSSKFFEKNGFLGEELYNKAINKDLEAIKIFKEFGFHLANALKKIIDKTNPKIIVLGGSVSKSLKFFKKSLMNELKKSLKKNNKNNDKNNNKNNKIIVIASKKKYIALLGTYSLFKKNND